MTEMIRKIRSLPEGKEQIDNAVELILQKTDFDHEKPVPIVKIAQDMGFEVYQQSMESTGYENLSGYIAISGDLKENFPSDKIISVAENESIGHKRFTIAHELAHFLFDFDPATESEYYETYRTGEDYTEKEEEKRANSFAACLLMPKDDFRRAFEEMKVDGDLYETVNRLAARFQVSVTAAKLRIPELGLSLA